MNLRILLSILFITITQLLFSQTYSIALTVTDISKIEGEILIAVYNNEETFLDIENAFKVYSKKVKKNTMVLNPNNYPKGNYSIALFHDEDINGKMERNFLGIPSEDYGFSNISSTVFSRPSYEETKFYLNSDTTITIPLL